MPGVPGTWAQWRFGMGVENSSRIVQDIVTDSTARSPRTASLTSLRISIDLEAICPRAWMASPKNSRPSLQAEGRSSHGPDALLCWLHRFIAAKWTYPAKKRIGRLGIMKRTANSLLRFATDN